MPRIVKNNAVLEAEKVEETIFAPSPGGELRAVVDVGGWALWKEADDGLTFVGFISDREYREKHQTLLG